MPIFGDKDPGGKLGEMYRIGCKMGEDFWDIERVKAAGFSFSDSDVAVLDSMVFTEEQVGKYGKGCRLVAFPSCSVADMLNICKHCFAADRPKDAEGHLYDHRLVFEALSTKVRAGWCLVAKDILAGSLGQPYAFQMKLAPSPAQLASVRVVTQVAIVYASLFGGKWFLPDNLCVRTKNTTFVGPLHIFNFDPERPGIRIGFSLTTSEQTYPQLGVLPVIWPADAVREDLKNKKARENVKGPPAKSG